MFKRFLPVLLVVIGLLVGASAASGQGNSEVYVTTQDYASLRGGPGIRWERLAVLPYSETYRATGRTVDGDWIQIAYTGELQPGARTDFTRDGVTYGWVAYWLLTWKGDILQLPIDGVQTVPIARAAGPTMILWPDEYMYIGGVDPSTRVDNPMDTPVTVEVTGRLGRAEAGYFWLQFKLGGRYYWTGSWAVGVPGGYLQLPDGSYLYSYGRLLIQTRSELNHAYEVLYDIGGRWSALDNGQPTTCNAIPDDFSLRENSFAQLDLSREPIYAPLAAAMRDAQASINAALERFRAVCADSSRTVSPEDIRAALEDVASADRNLTIVETLLVPLQRRDPLVGEIEDE